MHNARLVLRVPAARAGRASRDARWAKYARVFNRSGLTRLIGADNVILATDELFGALNSALRDARRWIADPDRLPSPPRRCLPEARGHRPAVTGAHPATLRLSAPHHTGA